jgi:hypothetical protein
MNAFIFAQCILMVLWLSLGVKWIIQQPLFSFSSQGQRLGVWLAWGLVGGAALVGIGFYALPHSIISQGWSREDIEATHQWTAFCLSGLLVGGGLWVNAILKRNAPTLLKASIKPAMKVTAGKIPQKKRRQ